MLKNRFSLNGFCARQTQDKRVILKQKIYDYVAKTSDYLMKVWYSFSIVVLQTTFQAIKFWRQIYLMGGREKLFLLKGEIHWNIFSLLAKWLEISFIPNPNKLPKYFIMWLLNQWQEKIILVIGFRVIASETDFWLRDYKTKSRRK